MNTSKLVFIPIFIMLLILFSCTSSGTKAAEPDRVDSSSVTELNKDERRDEGADTEHLTDDITSAEAPDMLMPAMEEADAGYGLREMESAKSVSGSGFSAAPPAQSGLKAGYSDDNRQYGYFLGFLEDYRGDVVPVDIDVSERIMLKLTDADGNAVPGALIKVQADRGGVRGVTLADGSYQINPSEVFTSGVRDLENFMLEIEGGDVLPGFYRKLTVPRDGMRTIEIPADTARIIPDPIPLDLVFVMDTTGSMGEEISRLKNTIRIIHMNLSSMKAAVELRFGMVLYKDVGDEYRTKLIPLTSDLDEFQEALNEVEAYGGGDTPEDLEAALGELINSMNWNPGGVKLSYIITDAAPHLDYQTDYTCSDALRDAREQGIKIFGIGTGGLDLQGEYNLRQIAQYTSARYIFLTYGDEPAESGGGAPGSVSHHTGSNWSADKLESIIIRFTREELSHLSDSPLIDEDPWFEADKLDTETAEETLSDLFGQALDQLLDYSASPVSVETPAAVLPFSFEGEIAADAEYFNEHLILAAGGNERIKLAERKDIAQLLAEIEFQNIGLTDDGTVGRIGEFLNAEILISGNLFIKDGNFELFLKMLRVETAEVLSVTRAVIDEELGL